MSEESTNDSKYRELKKTYQIVTNLSCNLDCEYCYERKYSRNNREEDIVDYLHACFERDKELGSSTAQIDIIGGEPFMQPKLLIAAFETAELLGKKYNRGFEFSISTNGTLFDKKINRDIVERWKDKLSIGVSIDGLPEQHDKYRIYTSTGKGSYSKAVEGYNYLKTVGLRNLGIKATFTLESLPYFAAGMKSIIDLCGDSAGTVSGNVVFEEVIPNHMAPFIACQMIEVIEHWESKGLHLDENNSIPHIIPEGFNFKVHWDPARRMALKQDVTEKNNPDRTGAFCGSLVYMTCLGFDRKIYGCNRFLSSVTTRNAVGELVDKTIVLSQDDRLLKELTNQFNDYPEHCKSCPIKTSCGNCAAAPYEHGDGGDEARKEYHSSKRQCGWTMAKTLVSEWFFARHGTYNYRDLVTKCSCFQCRTKKTKCTCCEPMEI